MFKHILLATDGSDLAQKAVAQGLELARQLNAKVSVLTVTKPWWTEVVGFWIPSPPVIRAYEKSTAEGVAKMASLVGDVAKEKEINCSVLHIKEGHPVDGIIESAKKSGCDLIVVGSHGRRGVERILLGSVAAAVVAESAIPVLVCR